MADLALRFWNFDTLLKFEKDLRSGLLLKMRPELNGASAPEYNFNRFTKYHHRYIKDSQLIDHHDMPDGVTADIFKSKRFNTWYLRYLEYIYTFKSLHACQALCELLSHSQELKPVTLPKAEDLVRLEKIRKRLEAYMNAPDKTEYSTVPLEPSLRNFHSKHYYKLQIAA